jgi:two-component system chemotaxis response regulator CheY
MTILIVEDDEDLRVAIEWMLDDVGYTVMTAANGAEALQQLERERPDVILLDMRMPVMDGWGFARAYRQQAGPQAPIIVLTAAQDAAEWARQIQAADYVAKPFEVDQLLRTIERHAA